MKNTQNNDNKPNASGVKVHCAHGRMVDVTTLIPNPRNPNKHGDKQIALLAKIIRHQGWRAPITVSKRSGFVVTGHGRLEAAKLLQVELVPVDEQDFATEADEWAHLIADNRIAELAEIDGGELAALLRDLESVDGFDLDLSGFDKDEAADLIGESSLGTDEIYTNKIISPVYEPKGDKPLITDLVDRSKTEQLLAAIRTATLPSEVAEFLSWAAERHTQFHFARIAEFYCHADPATKELMENSALVIIDFNKAIEGGFVKLTSALGAIADVEGSHEE
jgi:hypothetical protein